MRKPAFCIFGNHEADQRLCFRYTDSTIPLLPIYTKFQAYIAIVLLYSPVCVWDLVGNPEDQFSHNEAHMIISQMTV